MTRGLDTSTSYGARSHFLAADQIALARKLWLQGKNTAEIAKVLCLQESVIYNGAPYKRADNFRSDASMGRSGSAA